MTWLIKNKALPWVYDSIERVIMNIETLPQRVLVSAASSGIGKATACAFQLAGAQVAICARGEERLTEAQQEIEATTGKPVLAFVVDLSVAADISNMMDELLGQWGAVDVLVNKVSMMSNGVPHLI
jgi:NADP-dependent 3-hydroxy acid dehydrogenase YdfG